MRKNQIAIVFVLALSLAITSYLTGTTSPKSIVRAADADYIGQSCIVGDGRGGTCEYVTAPDAITGNCQTQRGAAFQSVPGYCPGTANVQCCVPPATQTGGNAGFIGFAKYAVDCTNGVSVTAAYQAGADPTKPPIYYNLEVITDQSQAGIGKGTLIAQDVSVNQGTFETKNPLWYASGKVVQFYIYTIPENTDPKVSYTINGIDATGAIVSRKPSEPPPFPFALSCPISPQPPAPPPIVPPPPVVDGGRAVNMDITIRLFMPLDVNGATNQTPVLTTIPTVVTITDQTQSGDDGSKLVDMKQLNNGIWEGTYTGLHIPGTGFAISVKPLNHAKKTFCHVGPGSVQELYPPYECDIKEGTIALNAGANVLDFSHIQLGAGDIAFDQRSDGVVDSQDLFAILLTIYKKRPYNVKYDVNLDGTISQKDFDLALQSFLNISH
jgi:hypothetical protein